MKNLQQLMKLEKKWLIPSWRNVEGNKIFYYRADNEQGEAQFVAGKINELAKDGSRKYSDIAIAKGCSGDD